MDAGHAGRFRRHLRRLPEHADVLLLAGDLTANGTLAEGRVVAAEMADLGVPVVAVLGNHDHQAGWQDELAGLLTESGVHVLEATGTVLECHGVRLGIVGLTGFVGGFDPLRHDCDPDVPARQLTAALAGELTALDVDVRVALTHYAPTVETLAGESPRLHPRLGSKMLGRAIDLARADLAVHGHAHHGIELGRTPGGVPVRNVAYPVIRTEYRVYALHPNGDTGDTGDGVLSRPGGRLGGVARWVVHRGADLMAHHRQAAEQDEPPS